MGGVRLSQQGKPPGRTEKGWGDVPWLISTAGPPFRRLKLLEEEVQKLEEEQHLGPAAYISWTVDLQVTFDRSIWCDMY